MNRCRHVISLLLVVLFATTWPSHAEGEGGADGDDEGGTILVTGNDANDGESSGGTEVTSISTTEGPSIQWTLLPDCETVGSSGCLETFSCPDGAAAATWVGTLDGEVVSSYPQCPGDPDPDDQPPVDIPGEVLTQFKKVPLPESVIAIQPPGGETLVNLPTILSTKAKPFVTTVRLDRVDVSITLSIAPVRFVWHHGDDTSAPTSDPGGAYLKDGLGDVPVCAADEKVVDCVTHTYLNTADDLDVSVDTTWAATYQVNGIGPWRNVRDTVTMEGAPMNLTVLEAKPQLVH